MKLSKEVVQLLSGEKTAEAVVEAYREMDKWGIGVSRERWEALKKAGSEALKEILVNTGEEDFSSLSDTVREKVKRDPLAEFSVSGKAVNVSGVASMRGDSIYGVYLEARRIQSNERLMQQGEECFVGGAGACKVSYSHGVDFGQRFRVVEGFNYDAFVPRLTEVFQPTTGDAVLRRVTMYRMELGVAAALSGDKGLMEAVKDPGFFAKFSGRGSEEDGRRVVYSSMYGLWKSKPFLGRYPEYTKWVEGVKEAKDPGLELGPLIWNRNLWNKGIRVAVVMKSVCAYLVRFILAEIANSKGLYRVWGVTQDEIFIQDWGESELELKGIVNKALGKLGGLSLGVYPDWGWGD